MKANTFLTVSHTLSALHKRTVQTTESHQILGIDIYCHGNTGRGDAVQREDPDGLADRFELFAAHEHQIPVLVADFL